MPILAAATLPFLDELVALFAAAILVAYLCYKARLVTIAGFLLAGVLIGPSALGLVDDSQLIAETAEIGVILLLFTIGVEFSLEKLGRIKRFILVGGGLQVGMTTALVAAGVLLLGATVGEGLFTGFLVALSSTAIVLKLLADRAETDSPAGQMTLAVLIFQDLAIVIMVLLVPVLGGAAGDVLEIVWALGKAVLVVALVLVLARKGVPWLLEKVVQTRRDELFLLTVVALCFGTAWLTSLAGVSLALGAFLAGLVVSESPYASQALNEVLPLRTLFSAVFFVSVGMLLDVGFLIANLPLVLAGVLLVLVIKAALTTVSVLALGYPSRIAAASGMALAQIGEFSFVLAVAGAAVGLYPAGLGETGSQAFIAITVLLMLATPFLLPLGPRLGGWLERHGVAQKPLPTAVDAGLEEPLDDHVIIAGFGPTGERLVRVLRSCGLKFVVLEMNPRVLEIAEEEGWPALYGDASRAHLLEHAGIHQARQCIVAINDRTATERVVRQARQMNPTLQIVARARFLADVEGLHTAGADIVVPEELETAVRIFTHVLQAYLIPEDEINDQVQAVRAEDYSVLRGSIHEAHLMVLRGLDEEGLHTRAVLVQPEAPAAGKTLAELDLRNRHGLTVLAIRRAGQTFANPQADTRVEPGDRLILIGVAATFGHSASLFAPQG